MRTFRYDDTSDLEAETPLASFRFAEAAYRGQVGTGGFDYEDPSLADLVGLKELWADESLSNPTRFFTGRLAERGIGRGAALRTGDDRQWQVSVVDLNTMLDDYLLLDTDCNRPAETDVERVLWLVNTSGTLSGVDDSFVAAGDEVDMEARDYRDGSHPRNVLDECAEESGKNFFLFSDGNDTYLFYDLATNTAYEAEGELSSVLAELDDPDAVLATVYGPSWGTNPAMRRDPLRVYSDVQVRWDGGEELVHNGTTETQFRARQTSLYDSSVKSATQAQQRGAQYLEAASSEEDTLTVPVVLPATKLGLFLPGQRVNTNFPHLGGSQVYRITKRGVEPWKTSGERYLATLTLASPVKITRFGGRPPGGNVPGGGPVNPPVPDDGGAGEHEVCDGISGYPGSWTVSLAACAPDGAGFGNEMTAVGDTITILPAACGTATWPDGYGNTARYDNTDPGGFPMGVGLHGTLSGRFSIPLLTGANRVVGIGFTATDTGPIPDVLTNIPLESTLAYGTISGQHLPDNDTYFFKWQLGAAVNRMKLWSTSDSEPGTWGINVLDYQAVITQFEFGIGVADSPTLASQPYTIVMDQLTWCYTATYPTGYRGASYGPVFVAEADGITGEFSLPAYPGLGYIAGSLAVTVDGMWQPVRELDPAAGTFDFGIHVPDEGDQIYASWRVPT